MAKTQWIGTALHPPNYFKASIIVSIGGLLNGLDTGVIGPVTTMPTFKAYFGNLSSDMHGLVVSSVLISATIASLCAGPISDNLGRTRLIALGSVVFAFGAALEAGAVNLAMLISGRLVVGTGEGLFLSTLVVYICEISPPSKRGPLASMVQVSITLGLCIGYFMCYGTVKIASSMSWRFPLAIQAGIALLLAMITTFYLPQSPRWLAYKKRNAEAVTVWDTLGVSDAEREKMLLTTTWSGPRTDIESPGIIVVSWRRIVKNISRTMAPDARKQMLLGVFLMSMQQLSGIDGVLYYAPLLFQQAGLSSSSASFLASGVSAILIFVTSIPAFLLSDRWGRRASTIYGGLVLSAAMVLIGSMYASNSVHPHSGAGRWVVIVSIYIFAVTYCMRPRTRVSYGKFVANPFIYCIAWALSIKIFASEIQPVATRATATSLSQSANCVTNFFVAFITPVLLARSSSGIYFLFFGASIITVIICAIYMPETQGDSLEAINEDFREHEAKDAALVRVPRSLFSRIVRTARKTSAGCEGVSTGRSSSRKAGGEGKGGEAVEMS
ncbi:MAG: hypothetical protein MMC33_001893 [Icmadophila ericetorum]|nr:hypothetical protein [Icmadophila ericetorum]